MGSKACTDLVPQSASLSGRDCTAASNKKNSLECYFYFLDRFKLARVTYKEILRLIYKLRYHFLIINGPLQVIDLCLVDFSPSPWLVKQVNVGLFTFDMFKRVHLALLSFGHVAC